MKRSLLIRALLAAMKAAQPPCKHEFDYRRDMTNRDDEGKISCKCCKCGEIFKADCGLHLPGTLIQKAAP